MAKQSNQIQNNHGIIYSPNNSLPIKLLIGILEKSAIAILTLILIITGTGYFSEQEHETETSILFEAPAGKIWEALANIKDLHAKQPFVKTVELTGLNENNLQIWREHLNPWGTIDYEIGAEEEGEMIVINMLSCPLKLTGSWTYRLIENKEINITTVTVSEKSEVSNPFARGILTIVGRNLYTKNELQLIKRYVDNLYTLS